MTRVGSSRRRQSSVFAALFAAATIASLTSAPAHASPLTCAPLELSHSYSANNQTWNQTFTKEANGCGSIWLVASKNSSYTYLTSHNGGVGVGSQSCTANTVCQLLDPASVGDTVSQLEVTSGAPVSVKVYY